MSANKPASRNPDAWAEAGCRGLNALLPRRSPADPEGPNGHRWAFVPLSGAVLAGILAVSGAPATAAQEGSPPVPYLHLREGALGYHGPDPDLTALPDTRIGWFGPWDTTNGPAVDLWCAAQLALAEANARVTAATGPAGSEGSPPLRLIPRWSTNPWGTGVAQLAKMVFADQPVALLGSVDSAATHLAEQVVAKANLPLVSPITTDPSVTLAGVPWMFSCAPSDAAVAQALGRGLLENPTVSAGSIALLTTTDHESRMTARAVVRELKQRQRPPDFRYDLPPGTPDLRVALAALAATAPSAIVIIAGPEDAAKLLQAAKRQVAADRSCAFFGTPAMARAAFRERAGPAAEGVRFPVLAQPDPQCPRTIRFIDRFRAERGYPPDDAALLTYDATWLLCEAIRVAGPSRARVREVLAQGGPWEGIAGRIHFDGTGQNTRSPLPMATFRAGTLVRIPSSEGAVRLTVGKAASL